MISSIYWRESGWLWLSLLPVVLLLISRFGIGRKLTGVVDSALLPWVVSTQKRHENTAVKILLALAWGFFCIALAGPRTPQWIPPELRPANSSLMVILDLSASMQAGDLRPDRKSVAGRQIKYWINHAAPNMNIGLAVFAGHGHLLLPVTSDRKLVNYFLEDLDALQLPTLGNNLAEALLLSVDALQGKPGKKSILLISDGDLGAQSMARATSIITKLLPKNNIQLYIAGVGGSEPVALPAGLVDQLLAETKTILTRRESANLIELARAGGGEYWPLESIHETPLVKLLEVPTPRIKPDASAMILWDEWFGLPLLVAILLLFLVLQRSSRRQRVPGNIIVLCLLLPIFLSATPASATTPAETALENHDYRNARRLFEKEKGFPARFGEGVACYRLKDYLCSRQAFSQAAWLATTPTERGRAVYNLGNSHFQLGEFADAIVLFKEARRDGVPEKYTKRNLDFATDLAESVKNYLTHIEMTKRRADWLSNARDIPEGLLDRLTEGITLKAEKANSKLLKTLGKEKYRALVRQGVARAFGKPATTASTPATWSAASKSLPPESTVGLLNRLLPLEAGLNVVPAIPYRLEGERPW
ncbi:MAG TPA: VWA domain-containing protein [Gammaproteobacteria bacterium]|nr:VWA domain-containing protein [Gammaproteobacteria bacterium]